MTLDEKIAFFFAPPLTMQPIGTVSTLHLLRRETQDCLIGTVVNEDEVIARAMKESHRLFAALMVLMAGTDLLGKFYAGSDDIGGVGARFKGFAAHYMFPNAADPARSSEVLYLGLRNPLLHSFTLYEKKLEIWLVTKNPQFDVIPNPANPINFLISIEGVYVAFIWARRSESRPNAARKVDHLRA